MIAGASAGVAAASSSTGMRGGARSQLLAALCASARRLV